MILKKTVLSVAICGLLAACSGEEEPGTDSGVGAGGGGSNVPIRLAPPEAASVNEGDPDQGIDAEIKLRLSAAPSESVSVDFTTVDSSALAGEHYTETAKTVTFAAGERTKTITVPILSNDMYGDDKAFSVEFSNPSGITLDANETIVTIINDDPLPELSFAEPKFITSEQAGSLTIPVQLSNSSEEVTRFSIDVSGTATPVEDYEISASSFEVEAKQDVFELPLDLVNDSIQEGGETIILRLNQVEKATINSKANELTVVIAGDSKLPDTGVTKFVNGDDFAADVPGNEHPFQDANYGLDAGATGGYNQNGYASMEYTKLDIHGNTLPQSASQFSCVRDNLTGVVYEVRPSAAADGPAPSMWRDMSALHHWYNPDDTNNAGYAGPANDTTRFTKEDGNYIGDDCTMPDDGFRYHKESGCSTKNYLDRLNHEGYCGFNDWRLPTINEVQAITIYDSGQSLDPAFFPDINAYGANTRIPTATPSADNNSSVWCFNPSDKRRQLCLKSEKMSIRAARSSAE